jgi:hypothetical protein
MQSQLLTLAPVDIHSIPWGSVLLPLGTPVAGKHGGVLKRVPTSPCILVIGLRGHSLGVVPQPRLLSPMRSSLQAFQEKCRHVSVLLSQHETALTGRGNSFVSVRVGVLLRRSCHRTLLWCKAGNGKLLPIAHERYNGPVQVVRKHGHECIISGVATRNQVGRHGLYPGHYSGIFVAPRTHKMQKPSVSQGPILLLALSASTTSAYTSLGVSQASYRQPQLLKASV